MSVRVRVPAKINLHLSVGPSRADGYHDLTSLFHAVDLVDELIAAPGAGVSLRVLGEDVADVPADETNLAWRAAELLAEAAGVPADVALTLHKSIPVAGGMAGGSADAAAALLACSRLWGVELDLAPLAARLGADVAFPLHGHNALGTGRGEQLVGAPDGPELHWVLVLADVGISAGAAYAELDRQRAAGPAPEPIGSADELLAALWAGSVERVAAALANDLQPAAVALHPPLAATLADGLAAGALAGLVSGSGPTCALLAADAEHAEAVADSLATDGYRVRLATGPAPGARVIG